MAQIAFFLFANIANGSEAYLRLPNGYLLEAAVKYQAQTQNGELSDIQAYYGRFGANIPNELKQKIINDANSAGDNTKILWTLKSTYQQALIYQQKLAANGIQVVIVEIPDAFQQRLISKVQAQMQGLPQIFWWHTKDGFQKIMSPRKTLKQIKNITKDQLVGPKENDLFITYVKLGVTTAVLTAGAIYSFSVGVMPETIVAFSVAKLFFLGTTSAFYRTISNFMKTSFLDDFAVKTTFGQITRQIGFMGFGISQVTSDFTSKFDPTFNPALSSTFDTTRAVAPIDSLASSTISNLSQRPLSIQGYDSNSKNNLDSKTFAGRSFSKSDSFTLKMFALYSVPLLILSSLKINGLIWTVPTAMGDIHLTAVQGASVISLLGAYLGIKIYNSQFEKTAANFMPFSFKTMLRKASIIQKKILSVSKNPFYTKKEISTKITELKESYVAQPICTELFK